MNVTNKMAVKEPERRQRVGVDGSINSLELDTQGRGGRQCERMALEIWWW